MCDPELYLVCCGTEQQVSESDSTLGRDHIDLLLHLLPFAECGLYQEPGAQAGITEF